MTIEINEFDLPLVPCLIHPTYNDDAIFKRYLIDELLSMADDNLPIRWALETIREQQDQLCVAFEKFGKIEEITRGNFYR